ncbi:DNA polymerase III subunit delta' [Cellulomonas sp. zg-ZUI222]|uniref:DNA polymerase III subunit delta n=1 Tax=Cellulomonas wangleii TaxID=2816956 RepID=A0ABX8D7D2_9CELL|nr:MULTISPECIES: DNA polymerase III subunit delta' [Cellulomonas]MBO0901384.1 DNA polymerase III subunit delta' [Cellulomonas sp. zg-ZUI22]MBO0921830.1 DNA polymerase III subunit delta' [Cellulomonas wangleii]MBO0924748.1 DNA polymerase III subunit delta' [Cellulomonas wangleii]QVI62928.1 DNA polymerase III subunit delta' [Cellulomonas wangleii]
MSVWDDLVGQEPAVAVLRRAVTDPSAMTHAWLLTGPPGSGRSNAARAFAAALQCEAGGCGTCHACTTVLSGAHPDVTLVATEGVFIRVDTTRPLVELAQRSPSQGRWRVIVVEDADRFNDQSANVLLKAIEEPPPRTVWLLCAPGPEDVLVTIRSRSRAVGLRVPPVDAVAELLVRRDGADPRVAQVAARAAQSHIGIARRLARDPQARERRAAVLSLASRVRGVGDAVLAAGELVETAQADAKAATEERDAAERNELLRGMGADGAQQLPPSLRAQVRQLEEEQKRRATRAQRDVLDRAMVDLLSLYRDVLVVQLGAGVDLVNVEQEAEVRALAAGSTPEQTLRRMDAVGQARTRLAGNVAPLLAVEAMAIALRPQG